MAEKPAPAFDRAGSIQGFCSDLKMIQLQKVNLQIVSYCDGQRLFTQSEVKMQLCGLPDERPGQNADADGRSQVRVTLPLLQPSDIRLGCVEDHSFGHSSRQCDLDFNVEFSSESVFGKHVEDKESAVVRQFAVHGIWKGDVRNGYLPAQHCVDKSNRQFFLLLASKKQLEGVIDQGIDSDDHGISTFEQGFMGH